MLNNIFTKHYKELLIAFGILLFSCLFYFHLFNLHEEALLATGEDVWFQGDMPRITDNMTDRYAFGHNRLKVHPLLSLQTYPPVYVLTKIGLSEYRAIQLVSITIAGLWSLTFYAFLRVFGCMRIDALLLLILALSSAATLFWLPTPESYALGSISIMTALMLAIVASRTKVANWVYVLISGFSFSVTVTNWMAGILATYTTQPKLRATVLTLAALSLVTVLWLVEKQIFPAAGFFIGDDEEANYMYYPYLSRIFTVLVNIFSHSVITPEILTLPNYHQFGKGGFNWTMVSVHEAMIGSAAIQGVIATVLWMLLLCLGIWSFCVSRQFSAFKTTLALTLAGQVALHILYGEETFLYALHFLPLLIGITAFSMLNHLRPIAITLIVLIIPLMMINNWQQFKEASNIAISPRNDVLKQMTLRPHDIWTIHDSHAILALPGSLEGDKAYIEPGGSFSPKPGSFGLSIWLNDQQKRLVTSSDTVTLPDTQQKYMWENEDTIPSIVTTTPFYKSTVRMQHDNSFVYNIEFSNEAIPTLFIRSVGPSGGPIHAIRWQNKQLIINDKWLITFMPSPNLVTLGEEGIDAWHSNTPDKTSIKSKNGWAFASIKFNAKQPVKINIQELNALESYQFPRQKINSQLTLNLPDQRFSDSLNAQIANIMMSLVKDETRPGDPTNYPLNWQRDGAYILVALAKAGQLERAKALSKEFAEEDFFGGFGAEADAPGLSIWALIQVATTLNQPTHDKWLWPHVERKAKFIEQMLTTEDNLFQMFKGNVVPEHLRDKEKHLVAEPAKNGLIIGRMDHHRPLLFVNAVSYLGLLEAAELANRLGKNEEARHWSKVAKALKLSWEKAFTPENENERTYISALWPTWIAKDTTDLLTSRLEQRWHDQHDTNNQFKTKPLWTYFNVAESHQWLFLGQTNRVWANLEWFWQHQSMPNLYTWWEGDGEENSFGIWQNIRGWVKPKNVNPHYWTAAEMALLQMDMLGYLDETKETSRIIIGGGIPLDWLSKPMDVEKLQVGAYTLDWHWNNGVMKVIITGGKPIEIALAKHFPSDANLVVSYR